MFSLERDQDTICATATPAGPGAIAVVRLSGVRARAITQKISSSLPETLESHRVYYTHIVDPQTREKVDEVLVTFFAQGRSFTGEDVVEISCHGSQAITEEVLRILVGAGARLAERGEFTYRAFNSGRIDLVQAESVLSLINSDTARAARLSLRQLAGELSTKLHDIENDLTWALSRLEANIDFSSEFIEFADGDEILSRAQCALQKIEALLQTYRAGRILKDGLVVAIVGAPNVGKSSLLNALLGEKRAIVSPHAGTTRDRIEATTDLAGHKVVWIDTAGLRETSDEIEKIGTKMTEQAVLSADILVFLADAVSAETHMLPESIAAVDKRVIKVGNKADLLDPTNRPEKFDVLLSAKTGEGLERLKAKISEQFSEGLHENAAALTQARHYEGLRKAEYHLRMASHLLKDQMSPEFVIAEMQESLLCVLQTLGKEFDDQVIDRVFREFCLGK